jgi:predicted metal-dependent RNase
LEVLELELVFCGGAREVGASCYLVKLDGKNILLDCGIRHTASKDSLPDFRLIQESGGLDAIVVSHAHTDHTGALPAISRQYPDAPVYMTHATKDLTRVLLYDSLKIMEKEMEIPVYAENHVKEMLDRTLCFSPHYPFNPFNDREITITFYSAGHIAGAAAIYMTGKDGSLFYSGDFCGFRQNTVEGASIPSLRPDVAIFESTYGDRLHSNRQIEETKLIDTVSEVLTVGGKVLIPAFALGRAQEVILILKKALNQDKLPKYPVYIDGMVKDICRIYKLNPNYLRANLAKKVFKGNEIFYGRHVIPVENQDMRKKIVESGEPCVIISSSGMLAGGPSQWYAEALASDEKNLIALTGYQDEESPGRKILELIDNPPADTDEDRTIKLGEKNIILKCRIGKYGLSAHGDMVEILGLANSLYPRNTFLVHGDPQVIYKLGKEIQKDINTRVFVPSNGEEFDVSVKVPRKQKVSPGYSSMNRSYPLNEQNIVELWEFVHDNIGAQAALSPEELSEIWGYTQNARILKDILNNTPYFEPDSRRMFLYHAVQRDEIEKFMEPEVMELNSMLALADEYFGPETGLYKKGARFDEKIAILYFNFPEVSENRYADRIEQFEEMTGWKVEINRNVNTAALNEVLYELLPDNVTISKVSYMGQEKKVAIFLDGDLPNRDEITSKFHQVTGLTLNINEKNTAGEKMQIKSPKPGNQMEQNRALKHMDSAFSDMPHRPYKKSIKVAPNGVKYIELSFISKTVGERYRDIIENLERETGYTIVISGSCNQMEVINVAKLLAKKHNISLKKNPSIYLDQMAVEVTPVQEIPREQKQILSDELFEMTGFTLSK